MSFLSNVGCMIGRHQPLRRGVVWDGRVYVGECRHCGAPIIRHGHHDWRKSGDEA
jgi:hypothetical protein